MAEIIKNDKDFKVIKMNNTEAGKCNFGFELPDRRVVLDDHTNDEIKGDIYYVCVLNMTFSKKSYENWYDTAVNYSEDTAYENRYYNHYGKLLGLV